VILSFLVGASLLVIGALIGAGTTLWFVLHYEAEED
jgi:hypothetical protein